jgi:hypothetical protein
MLVPSIPGIDEPSDDATIWQYMDFTKLVSILERRELFFVRIDKATDPYEGTLSDFHRLERMPTYRAQHPERTEEQHQKTFNAFDNDVAEMIRSGKVLINCWHMNEFESAAMWELYAQRNSGIAIKTTYKRLKDTLDKPTSDPIKLALVEYHEGWTPEDNLYHRFLRKRKSFEHERELRGILQLDREGEGRFDRNQITESGKYVTVDVDTLISNIYVAPKAQARVVDLVKAVAAQYGLQREQVTKSDLYSLK